MFYWGAFACEENGVGARTSPWITLPPRPALYTSLFKCATPIVQSGAFRQHRARIRHATDTSNATHDITPSTEEWLCYADTPSRRC